jgi:hypothetical protein
MEQRNRRVKFSGHQTFPLRYGWLEKGYEFISNGKSFSHESAIVDLGVGKNMVDSIKYWCDLAGIIDDDMVTSFGRNLLDEESGWDPFLEDQASWWLLHWKLITNLKYKTSGTALFSYLRKPEFTKEDVLEAALRFVDAGKKAPSDKIIMRDVDCFIRSYCGIGRFDKNKFGEDAFDYPLQELNLIQAIGAGDFYRFLIGAKSSLPPEIIGYAICEHFGRENKRAMTIQGVLYKEESPGQVFMLDENALIDAIQKLHENPIWGDRFDFTESAGVAQVHCNIAIDEAYAVLNSYYRGEV